MTRSTRRGEGEGGLSWKNGSRDAERRAAPRRAEPIILSLRVSGINENLILCEEIPQSNSQVTVSLYRMCLLDFLGRDVKMLPRCFHPCDHVL